jgi:hypothetical protein
VISWTEKRRRDKKPIVPEDPRCRRNQNPIVPEDPAGVSNARVISWSAKRRRDQKPIVPEDPASLVLEGESAAVRVHIIPCRAGDKLEGEAQEGPDANCPRRPCRSCTGGRERSKVIACNTLQYGVNIHIAKFFGLNRMVIDVGA